MCRVAYVSCHASYGNAGQTFFFVSVLGELIVGVAVKPAFTILSRRDNRMTAAMGVLAGVTVR
jgi:hypothetical protein